MNIEERRLLGLRAPTGDPEALNVLFESCRKQLYCRATRILARPQDAEDTVQEAMLAAFIHLYQFQGRADFLTWATQIVTNEALQHIRKTRTKPTVSWDETDDEFRGLFLEGGCKRLGTPGRHAESAAASREKDADDPPQELSASSV